MKKSLLLAVAAWSVAACSIDTEAFLDDSLSASDVAVRKSGRVSHLVFTASQEKEYAATRTTLDTDGASVLWNPGDSINIFHDGCEPACFTNTNAEPSAEATFEGSITTHVITGSNEGDSLKTSYYWGLYPYSDNATYEDGVIITALPSVQTAVAGTFDDDLFITVGRSTTTSMPFYNVCSGFRFTVDREDITSLTISANGGEPLAGDVQVLFDDGTELPYVKVLDGVSAVTVNAPDGGCFATDTWYYVVTLPVTMESGFTISFGGETVQASVRTQSALALNRSKFRYAALTASIYDSVDLDIENEKVRAYLEEVDYSEDTDYSDSSISKYTGSSSSSGSGDSGSGGGGGWKSSKSSSSSREDIPAPVTFNWASSQERTLIYATDSEYSDATKVSVSSSDTSTEIYNLVPGKTYYWKTVDSSGEILNASTFVPVGPNRMIKGSTRNVRDLGGWQAGESTIAYGKVYRGAKPSSSDSDLFKSLGIGAVLDLRGNGGGTAEQVFADFKYVNLQPYQFMYKDGESAGYTQELYLKALHQVIDWLVEGKTVFFHCVGGADRTGTLSFLIEALLGVSENDLSKDYELTSFYSTRERNDDGDRPFKQLVFYMRNFKGETIQEMVTSWATDTLITNYLTADDIATLKKQLLE